MFISMLYAAAAVANLIVFLIGVSCMPAAVPVHLAGLTVDRLGSPWTLVAFPAVTAFLAIAFFPVALRAKRGRCAALAALAATGAGFAAAGWAFFGIAVQPAAFGEAVIFPYAALTAFPAGAWIAVFGAVLRAKTEGRRRAVGSALLLAGLLSAAVAVVFCFLPAMRLDWIACAILAGSVAIAAGCAAAVAKN